MVRALGWNLGAVTVYETLGNITSSSAQQLPTYKMGTTMLVCLGCKLSGAAPASWDI